MATGIEFRFFPINVAYLPHCRKPVWSSGPCPCKQIHWEQFCRTIQTGDGSLTRKKSHFCCNWRTDNSCRLSIPCNKNATLRLLSFSEEGHPSGNPPNIPQKRSTGKTMREILSFFSLKLCVSMTVQ